MMPLLQLTADNLIDVANLFNDYFFSMFKPPCTRNEYEDHLSTHTVSSEQLSDVSFSPDEVRGILLSLDVNKATGPDKIPARLLRNCAPYICSSLCAFYNKCLAVGKIPAAWKVSNIVPIPKRGSAKEVSNYRPISLLPIVSKVLERCVYNRLIDHMKLGNCSIRECERIQSI